MKDGKKPRPIRSFFIKLISFLLFLLLIVGVGLYSFFGINPAEGLADGFTGLYNRVLSIGQEEIVQTVKTITALNASEALAYDARDDGFLLCSISALRFYNDEGEEKWYLPVELKKPFIRANGKKTFLADLSGRYLAMAGEGNILWEKTLDEDIVGAGLYDSWVYVITRSELAGYKRSIRLYSVDGDEIAFRNVSDYYPISLYHFPSYNSQGFIVCGVETQGLQTTGVFEFLNLSMSQTGSVRGEEELFFSAMALGREKLVLAGENSLLCVDSSLKTLWSKKPEKDNFTAAAVFNGSEVIAASLDQELYDREKKVASQLSIYDEDGKEKYNLKLDGMVTGISVYGDVAAVICGPEVYFIGKNGEIKDMYTARSNVAAVRLSRGDTAYIVSQGELIRVKIDMQRKFLGIF